MALDFTLASCEYDESARRSAHWYFTAHCRGCCARSAARSPHFFDSRKTERQTTGYRMLLQQFGLTHDEVKAAYAADCANHRARVTA